MKRATMLATATAITEAVKREREKKNIELISLLKDVEQKLDILYDIHKKIRLHVESVLKEHFAKKEVDWAHCDSCPAHEDLTLDDIDCRCQDWEG